MSWPCIPKGVLAVFVLLYRCQSLHLSDTPAWQNVYSFLSHTTCRCSYATSLVGDMCSHLGTFFCFHGIILEHSLSKLLVSEVKRTICSRMAHSTVQILSFSLSLQQYCISTNWSSGCIIITCHSHGSTWDRPWTCSGTDYSTVY